MPAKFEGLKPECLWKDILLFMVLMTGLLLNNLNYVHVMLQ